MIIVYPGACPTTPQKHGPTGKPYGYQSTVNTKNSIRDKKAPPNKRAMY